jgi:hypothetical protein
MSEIINGPDIIMGLTIPYTIASFMIYKKLFKLKNVYAMSLALFTTYVSLTALATSVFIIPPSKPICEKK